MAASDNSSVSAERRASACALALVAASAVLTKLSNCGFAYRGRLPLSPDKNCANSKDVSLAVMEQDVVGKRYWFTRKSKIDCGAYLEDNGDLCMMVILRSRSFSMVRLAIMPGTPQPEPTSIGMKLLPERPNLRKMRSIINAIRAI